MAIAGALVLLIALIVLGGYFFYQALPGGGDGASKGPEAVASDEVAPIAESSLFVRVTGEATQILVREAGGPVLTDTTVESGQHLSYSQPRLEATIAEPAAVEVYVNGRFTALSEEEGPHTLSVRPED